MARGCSSEREREREIERERERETLAMTPRILHRFLSKLGNPSAGAEIAKKVLWSKPLGAHNKKRNILLTFFP